MADRWSPMEDWSDFQRAHNGLNEAEYEAWARCVSEEAEALQAAFRAHMATIPEGRPDPAAIMSPDNPRRHWYE